MIILSIVLLGIFNTISASILERKQEIGNLRANGESIFQVMQMIITEGGLLAMIGSLIGMAVAYCILMLFIDKGLLMPPGPGQTRQFLVTFSFEWSMVFFTMMLMYLCRHNCFISRRNQSGQNVDCQVSPIKLKALYLKNL